MVGGGCPGGWRPVVACLGLALVAGCDDTHLRTLTPADVTGLPSGDAIGTGYSGGYISTKISLLGCSCRTAGSCATAKTTFDGATITLMATQVDGALTLDVPCTGGVDANGRFSCGGVGHGAGGDAYQLLTGRFVVSGVQVMGMMLLDQETTTDALLNHDCDLSFSASLLYAGP